MKKIIGMIDGQQYSITVDTSGKPCVDCILMNYWDNGGCSTVLDSIIGDDRNICCGSNRYIFTKIADKKRDIKITLNTVSLQEKLSQAVFHLQELNKILSELGIDINDIKVEKTDKK